MIDLSVTNGEPAIGQRLTSPAVYLDHWALLDFSESEAFGTCLSQTLEKHKGTLVLSWLNLGEYSKTTSKEQARNAELLIEKNLPRVFFMEIEPFRVIEGENRLLAGGPQEQPHGDLALLLQILYLRPESATSLNPFTAHNLFAFTQDPNLAHRFDVLADTVIERIELMRAKLGADSTFAAAVNRLPSGPAVQAGTRYILRELLRTFLITPAMKLTRNHALDFLHAVVPAAYCDYVLLDRHWEAQINQMRARVSRGGMSFPIAKAFSGKANGILRFLSELESTSPSTL